MVHPSAMQETLAKARKLAKDFASADGFVDVDAVARSLGVVSLEPRQMASDGYLGRSPEGAFVIRYRAGNSARRNRFTVAHEVGHILLARAQGRDFASPRPHQAEDRCEEIAVNRIGAELLMPQRYVWRELYRRDQNGEHPSWRTVATLRRLFDVSESAVALRILEIPHVDAILFRINIEGRGSNYPCDMSEHSNLRLVNSEEFEADRLWRDARRSTRSSVVIWKNGRKQDLRCDGLVRAIPTRHGVMKQYWVIGWELETSDGTARLLGGGSGLA